MKNIKVVIQPNTPSWNTLGLYGVLANEMRHQPMSTKSKIINDALSSIIYISMRITSIYVRNLGLLYLWLDWNFIDRRHRCISQHRFSTEGPPKCASHSHVCQYSSKIFTHFHLFPTSGTTWYHLFVMKSIIFQYKKWRHVVLTVVNKRKTTNILLK